MKAKKQIRIFIVDDNNVFAHVLKADIQTAFAEMKIDISTFGTGEKCLEALKTESPHMVILDYHLDGRNAEAANGIKILDQIKKEKPETYVIMLTGEDNIDIALKSFKHGASDYVVKTDTQFRKIIYSLFNLLRLMSAKNEALRYKRMVMAISLGVAMLIGGTIAIEIIYPDFFVV
ncbi:MAG: hypothetical protein A2W91_08385 [Bacteroidetes bacterium GWF2_38_335]|nr:MAG: hypothetical protein A2W91_08385 [Bacteroidetes bacterium GWF2_38_335]OFY78940.1 MAG: hypothetical protein A2281_02335 [Bacteroidetes bacterium RIFOXYA12_FULL_38_20]HBS86006.1 response regulator [Bacteroidales bacterium]